VGCSTSADVAFSFAKVEFRDCQGKFEEAIGGARTFQKFPKDLHEARRAIDVQGFLTAIYLDCPEKWD
jgi:hypothetical protein